LQTKHTQRDSAISMRSHKHYKQHLSDDYENRHVLNEVISDDVLKSSFDDQCIKFEVKTIKHDTFDETKHQKLKSNLKFNTKQSYLKLFSQIFIYSSFSAHQNQISFQLQAHENLISESDKNSFESTQYL